MIRLPLLRSWAHAVIDVLNDPARIKELGWFRNCAYHPPGGS